MIPLNFYRDDEYVYINNPDGTTKRVPIEDFENTFNADTAELPAYTSSDAGKVLTVNSGGTGVEWGEIASIDYLYPVTVTYNSETDSYTLDKTYNEILGALNAGKYVIGIGDNVGYTGARYYAAGVLYVQLLCYNVSINAQSATYIHAEGLQIAPDGTIENLYTANL